MGLRRDAPALGTTGWAQLSASGARGGAGGGLRERGNDTSKSTGCSGRQNAATRHNMRREERVTVQGPVKKRQPDGMSHGGGGGAERFLDGQAHTSTRITAV